MVRRFGVMTFLVWLVLNPLVAFAASERSGVGGALAWQPWSDQLFVQAKRENKFILLDLEAVWCHWCHVMDRETYRNPGVIKLIESRYIPVRVDQDARPDLSRRYENYGWPATIVFNAEGEEIVKRAGYIEPKNMMSMLAAIIDDPSPILYRDSKVVTEFARDPLLPVAVHQELLKRYTETHDFSIGGLRQAQKFMDRDTVEYALLRAKQGDRTAEKIARQTLDGALNLIDPAWGGVYQYSTHGDWKHAHFEKIMQVQAEYMRVYALAYAQFADPEYLRAGSDIHRYLKAFLTSPQGAFYTSQDADLIKGRHSEDYFALDDAARRKLGIPKIDKHLYARENGWMIAGLATLYAASGEKKYLDDAITAADWIIQHRATKDGGFRHDEADKAGPYLEDTLAMGRAFLSLYLATADRAWLARAGQAADFIRNNFADSHATAAGYATAAGSGTLKPRPTTEENISAARFFNQLARYTGKGTYRESAERAMRFLVTPDIALFRLTDAGILLAADELANEPVHITIVGGKGDVQAAQLYRAALRYPAVNRRIEWWDQREGAMPNADVQYPQLGRAAAFVCTNKRCSLPVFEAGEIAALADRLNQ
ncbi:MAG: thioredoxin domain-containing protein [Burkholderiales bacterium]|nr:thioredoxin domain-containing protein [Burkholderiales bacterium]